MTEIQKTDISDKDLRLSNIFLSRLTKSDKYSFRFDTFYVDEPDKMIFCEDLGLGIMSWEDGFCVVHETVTPGIRTLPNGDPGFDDSSELNELGHYVKFEDALVGLGEVYVRTLLMLSKEDMMVEDTDPNLSSNEI